MQKFIFIMLFTLLTVSASGCRSDSKTDVTGSGNTNSETASENGASESFSAVPPPYSTVPKQDVPAFSYETSDCVEESETPSVSVKPPAGTASKPSVTSSAPAVPKPPAVSSDMLSDENVINTPESGKTEPPAEKDPYAYPFDIGAIKKDLISYGENLGMKHRTHYSDGTIISQDNGSYELPVYISKDSTARVIKKALYEQLDYHYNAYHAEFFTIYIEAYGNSEYQIYSIYA